MTEEEINRVDREGQDKAEAKPFSVYPVYPVRICFTPET
jgi:hypothetical protein